MVKKAGFLKYSRINPTKLVPEVRIQNFGEFDSKLSESIIKEQTRRCMDCGVPFCHGFGCPLGNRIPDFNEKIRLGLWDQALDILHSTNNFPEFTGKVCPALCETSCTLSINSDPVIIKQIEFQLSEYGWENDLIKPIIASSKTGKKIAVIGSGPAGLAASQQLARNGHDVTVFEKNDRIGGLLRYGIPDYKLDKSRIDRRITQIENEGVIFETMVEVGVDISVRYLKRSFDAILVATGATSPRDLMIPGRELSGIHFAMDYLIQQNKINAGDQIDNTDLINAKGKNVVVIGGGDTGADCVGTAIRQGAKKVTQIELLPKPSPERTINEPWPTYPKIFRTSTSHEEGCKRIWSIMTNKFSGSDGKLKKMFCKKLNWDSKIENYQELPNSNFELDVDLILLSMGFINDKKEKLLIDLQKNSSMFDPKVVICGDINTGPSLVVHAINEGRNAAKEIDEYLIK